MKKDRETTNSDYKYSAFFKEEKIEELKYKFGKEKQFDVPDTFTTFIVNDEENAEKLGVPIGSLCWSVDQDDYMEWELKRMNDEELAQKINDGI